MSILFLPPSGGRVVSAPDFESRGPRFKFLWRQNLSHDYMALHCTEPSIITFCHPDMTKIMLKVM